MAMGSSKPLLLTPFFFVMVLFWSCYPVHREINEEAFSGASLSGLSYRNGETKTDFRESRFLFVPARGWPSPDTWCTSDTKLFFGRNKFDKSSTEKLAPAAFSRPNTVTAEFF